MKRISSLVLSHFAIIGLIFLVSNPAAAQMMNQGTRHHPPAPMQANSASMQSMMARMEGMMAEMQGMMHEHQGMMAGHGMSGMMSGQHGMMGGQGTSGSNGAKASGDDWPAMMRSMHALGASMLQMMARMDVVMTNDSTMANRTLHSDVKAMQRDMRGMMGSLDGMIHNMGQIQKSQQQSRK